MSEAIDRVLERVARAIRTINVIRPTEANFIRVLERELKPLLLAGQAMRDAPLSADNWCQMERAWDIALASNERPAERGKGNE